MTWKKGEYPPKQQRIDEKKDPHSGRGPGRKPAADRSGG
jgi:hypothetical protein